MNKTINVSFSETVILAQYICDLPDPCTDQHIEDALIEKFGCDLDGLHKILGALVPLADKARSPLTKTLYQGFQVDGHWLLKVVV